MKQRQHPVKPLAIIADLGGNDRTERPCAKHDGFWLVMAEPRASGQQRGRVRCAPLNHYNLFMAGRECYHCKQWIEDGADHNCWTTTEAALTQDLSEELRDAWERLRETAVAFGDQRIYASHSSIMFSRRSCYFFVRPKRSFLEVCVFLGRRLKAPQVRRIDRTSKSKMVHVIQIRHRDEVETPFTGWLQEAYALSDLLTATARTRAKSKPAPGSRKPARGSRTRKTSVAKKKIAARKSRPR